jgi:hypothetical protein
MREAFFSFSSGLGFAALSSTIRVRNRIALFLGLNQTVENRLGSPKNRAFQAVFRYKNSFLLEQMNRPLPRA